MFEDDDYQEQSDTWFGTGLRAHLGITPEHEALAPPPLPESTIPILRTDEDESAEAEQRARQLEAYEQDLAQQARWLQVRETELEETSRRLEDESRRLEEEALRLAQRSKRRTKRRAAGRQARELLRELAEQHVDQIVHVFEEALEARLPDGSPDFETRITAARALLSEAYGESNSAIDRAAEQTLEDELADLRKRKGSAG